MRTYRLKMPPTSDLRRCRIRAVRGMYERLKDELTRQGYYCLHIQLSEKHESRNDDILFLTYWHESLPETPLDQEAPLYQLLIHSEKQTLTFQLAKV